MRPRSRPPASTWSAPRAWDLPPRAETDRRRRQLGHSVWTRRSGGGGRRSRPHPGRRIFSPTGRTSRQSVARRGAGTGTGSRKRPAPATRRAGLRGHAAPAAVVSMPCARWLQAARPTGLLGRASRRGIACRAAPPDGQGSMWLQRGGTGGVEKAPKCSVWQAGAACSQARGQGRPAAASETQAPALFPSLSCCAERHAPRCMCLSACSYAHGRVGRGRAFSFSFFFSGFVRF